MTKKLIVENPNGDLIRLMDWAKGMSVAEQAAFQQAIARQQELNQVLVESGSAVYYTDPPGVTFSDSAIESGIQVDPEWKSFYDRYLAETGQQMVEVDDGV